MRARRSTCGRRIRSIEDAKLCLNQFDKGEDPEIQAAMNVARNFLYNSKEFGNLSIYEQRLHRSTKEALRQLRELQTERRARQKTEMDDAIRLLKTQQMKGLPFDPTAHGFVYASAEVTRESTRRDRLQDSLSAEKAGFVLTKYAAYRQKEAA